MVSIFKAADKMLGKRKRVSAVVHRKAVADKAEEKLDGSNPFKQYFEASFQPLPVEDASTQTLLEEDPGSDESTASEDSTWEGFSDITDGNPPPIEVVNHATSSAAIEDDPLRPNFRSFMAS